MFDRLLTRVTDHLRRRCESLLQAFDPSADVAFFDVAQFPWCRELEAHWREIRAELDALLDAREPIPTFQQVSPEQHVVSDDARWRTFFFRVFGVAIDANCRRCPRTAELLSRVPGLGNAMFSILLPGKHIPEHRGPYKGLLRYHLALRVPTPASSCWIDVAGQRRHWQEGASMIFDDSFQHSAANESDALRVVLFLDFARPVPRLLRPVNRAMIALIGITEFARRPRAYLAAGAPAAIRID